MGRAPCCDKAKVKRGPWSPEEDVKLKEHIDKHGTGGNWIALPQKAGLKRCGKSCRLRWLNYLRPNIKHGEFSDDEDRIICNLFANIGSRWSIIAGQLPGRTDNDIKNYWNTKLKKKLMGSLMVANSFTSPHQKMTMIPNNNNHQQCPILSSPSSYSSLLPPTLTYFNNIYTTPSDVKPLIITGEKISNITSNYVNFQNQDQFLMSCMHNYQEQESSANIKFGASAATSNDHQQASAASCSSSDGSNCYINKDHVDYQQWMMFNNGGIDDQKQENVGMFNGNYDQVVSDSLDYNVSSDLEEIRQLISTNNLSCNSSLNFFLDENKTTSYQEEKVEMYY